jgi:hypothetical protein
MTESGQRTNLELSLANRSQPNPVTTLSPSGSKEILSEWRTLATIVSATVAIIAVSFAIWQYVNQPSADFDVKFEHGPFKLPHRVLPSDFDLVSPPSDRKIREDVINQYQSIVIISVANVGNRPAENVRIQLPGNGEAWVERLDEGGTRSYLGEVELGTLSVLDTLETTIWLREKYDPSSDPSPIVVSDNAGHQVVREPGSWRPWIITAVGIVMVAIWVLAMIFVGYLIKQATASLKQIGRMSDEVTELRQQALARCQGAEEDLAIEEDLRRAEAISAQLDAAKGTAEKLSGTI